MKEKLSSPAGTLHRYITQNVEISNVSVSDGVRVNLSPLYKNYRWAVTSRWDDNPTQNVRMSGLLKKHGYKGTFYMVTSGIDPDIYNAVLADGNTIGAHSVTHPMMRNLPYAAIFRELLRSRMDAESAFDTPINSFAFPYNGDSYIDPDRPKLCSEMYDMLLRSGYIHVADPAFVTSDMPEVSSINCLPTDGPPVDAEFQAFLEDDALRAMEPNIAFNTHASKYQTDADWAGIENQLTAHESHPDYWYCTETDYGSYRCQYKHSEVTDIRLDGGRICFNLTRPSGVDTNSTIPLSLNLTGGDFAQAAVKVDGLEIACDSANAQSLAISVPCPHTEQPPTKIDVLYPICDEYQPSTDFPLLSARTCLDSTGNVITFGLKNDGPQISDVLITHRMPLGIDTDVIRQSLPDIRCGQCAEATLVLDYGSQTSHYRDGEMMIAAQMDFVVHEQRQRLYVVHLGGGMKR